MKLSAALGKIREERAADLERMEVTVSVSDLVGAAHRIVPAARSRGRIFGESGSPWDRLRSLNGTRTVVRGAHRDSQPFLQQRRPHTSMEQRRRPIHSVEGGAGLSLQLQVHGHVNIARASCRQVLLKFHP